MRDLAKSANGALLVLLETAYEEPRPPCGAIDLAPLLEHLRHALASPDMHVRVAVSAARLPCSDINFYFMPDPSHNLSLLPLPRFFCSFIFPQVVDMDVHVFGE